MPAPSSATRAAFAGPSTNSGRNAIGTPAASACSVPPEPPWPTIAAACGMTSACVDPALDADVRRQRAERGGVDVAADRHQHALGDVRERVPRSCGTAPAERISEPKET